MASACADLQVHVQKAAVMRQPAIPPAVNANVEMSLHVILSVPHHVMLPTVNANVDKTMPVIQLVHPPVMSPTVNANVVILIHVIQIARLHLLVTPMPMNASAETWMHVL